MNSYPEIIRTEHEIDDLLSAPSQRVIDLMHSLDGDIMILGVNGKMGPTIARMAVRACRNAGVDKHIYGVSRFSASADMEKFSAMGVEPIRCDLLDHDAVLKLPKVKNLIYMAGRKFGEKGTDYLTWMMNVIAPYNVARTFNNSKIVVFSTGCVYELVSCDTGGSKETDTPYPIGEYANTCLGRERIFEYYSRLYNAPVVFFRLNYSVELRYGALVDIALRVFHGQDVDVTAEHVNVIWQGDAAERALLSLAIAQIPPEILNVTGSRILSVKDIAFKFGEIFGTEVTFKGTPAGRCYLSNAEKSIRLFGEPKVPVDLMIKWSAQWIKNGGRTLDKPTHFEVVNGQFLGE